LVSAHQNSGNLIIRLERICYGQNNEQMDSLLRVKKVKVNLSLCVTKYYAMKTYPVRN